MEQLLSCSPNMSPVEMESTPPCSWVGHPTSLLGQVRGQRHELQREATASPALKHSTKFSPWLWSVHVATTAAGSRKQGRTGQQQAQALGNIPAAPLLEDSPGP